MQVSRIVLPRFQLAASCLLLAGFLLAITRVSLGFSVLNDWQFMFSSALISLAPTSLVLLTIFASKPYRRCDWQKKWPFTTMLLSIQILLASFMLVNNSGYFLNRLLPSADSYTADALVIARIDSGYRQFVPSLVIFSNLETGEKNVSTETSNQIEAGDIVPVEFQRGFFGYTNILTINP